MQIKEVKVKFEDGGKEYSFDCSDVFVKIGNKVVVDTANGNEIGTICSKVSLMEMFEGEQPLKKVLRIASDSDLSIKSENTEKEQQIKVFCEKEVQELNLNMKVISATMSFDSKKVLISFTADDRVDFRELLKRLANEYKMKIELRQIDAREETKIIGGLGPCGRECCCSNFLSSPTHGSIKMAKVQGLSLNPTSISGLCGKLKCCIAYENEHYAETFALMPKINSEVKTPDGMGQVVYNNLLKKTVSVKLVGDDGATKIEEYELDKIVFDGKKDDKKDWWFTTWWFKNYARRGRIWFY